MTQSLNHKIFMADVSLTVDGKKLTAPAGTLLIEACKSVGIEVPSFCYYPNLSLQGACRMCLVKIEKMPKLQTACTTVVSEGMVVTTESDEIKQATGEETVVSDLTYDLRSGSPDFVDRMVAFTFAGMAMDALEEGKSGLMTAINEGRYAMVAIPDPKLGPRKVDIASMYNTERYRPKYDHKLGLPIFLTRP